MPAFFKRKVAESVKTLRIALIVLLTAAVAARAESDETRQWSGVSAPAKSVTLSARMDGQISKIHVEEGDLVKKDQVLIKFDDKLLQLGARLQKVLSENETELRAAEHAAEYQKQEYLRAKNLWEKGTIPETEYLTAKTRYELAKIEIEAAKVRQKRTKLEYEAQLERLDHALVRSPIDGVVARKLVEEGESARNLMQLIEIIDVSKIRIKLHLPQEMLGVVDKNDTAVAHFDPIKGKAFEGSVDKIAPIVDARSRTFLVEVLVPNVGRRIRPGVSATVRFVVQPDEEDKQNPEEKAN